MQAHHVANNHVNLYRRIVPDTPGDSSDAKYEISLHNKRGLARRLCIQEGVVCERREDKKVLARLFICVAAQRVSDPGSASQTEWICLSAG